MARRWSGPDEHKEVVEIGAVHIDLSAAVSEPRNFSILVQPRLNPRLSKYFTDLTGISQTKLDNEGVGLEAALYAFHTFAKGATRFFAYGNDGEVIAQNCELIAAINPLAPYQMIDAREAIKSAYGLDHSITSSELPAAVGADVTLTNFRAHRALDDAQAVASVLVPLLKSRGGHL